MEWTRFDEPYTLEGVMIDLWCAACLNSILGLLFLLHTTMSVDSNSASYLSMIACRGVSVLWGLLATAKSLIRILGDKCVDCPASEYAYFWSAVSGSILLAMLFWRATGKNADVKISSVEGEDGELTQSLTAAAASLEVKEVRVINHTELIHRL